MTPELLDDLKQFIQAAFVQQFSDFNERFSEMDRRLDGIDARLDHHDQRFNDLELKLDTVIDTFGSMLIDHDARLIKLEFPKA